MKPTLIVDGESALYASDSGTYRFSTVGLWQTRITPPGEHQLVCLNLMFSSPLRMLTLFFAGERDARVAANLLQPSECQVPA